MRTIEINNTPSLFIRAIWFILVGWWLSGIWAVVAWLVSVTIIGLPIGVIMLNALPQVSTLQARRSEALIDPNGVVQVRTTTQYPLLVRALYFALIGWWLSAVWLVLAWACGNSIIGLPISFWMLDRTPAILILTRN